MTTKDTMTIREMCDAFDVTPRTLRFYEAKELLFPIRLGTRRLFTKADRARLTLHLTVVAGRNPHHVAEACFKAVAMALRQAVALRAGASGANEVPSTKGTLAG